MAAMSKAKAEKKALPKRFYAAAAIAAESDGFCILLDGKKVKTPQQQLLQCASQQLAQKIADEWNAQVDVIDTDTMPLTRLLNIALDRVRLDRDALLIEIAAYCDTDLLFYRAPSTSVSVLAAPDESAILAALQLQHFDPILRWAEQTHGVRFEVTDSIMPVAQPEASLQTLATLFAAATDHELAALAMMVPLLGSALLTLALWQGALEVESALVAARLDETLHEKKWGMDAEVTEKWIGKCRDVRAAAFFLTCK